MSCPEVREIHAPTISAPTSPLRTVIGLCQPLRLAPTPLPPPESSAIPETTDESGMPAAACGATDETWMPVAACTTTIPYLLDQMVATRGPHHPTTAAMHFTRALLRDVTYFSVASMALANCAPDISADNLWLRWRTDASFAPPALVRDTVGACEDSVIADRPDTVGLADEDALHRWFAERYVTTFGPLLDAVHTHTRVGRRILWGYVADSVGFRMLMVARDVGHDMAAAWTRGLAIIDALREAGAPISSRPRPFPVGSFDPPRLWAVRGVCCFDYKADPGHGYCVTCPLAADSTRHDTFWSLVQP